ncbi:unnamed protein product [Rotaria sp. Silwood2]|nr:unnamed protein product [Rotaria sp. Silwood2]CAF4512374.1 unnamed protein product [Rotaria sp. Silwood2]
MPKITISQTSTPHVNCIRDNPSTAFRSSPLNIEKQNVTSTNIITEDAKQSLNTQEAYEASTVQIIMANFITIRDE